MKSDELVTLRKMCYFKGSDWMLISTEFLLQWFKKTDLNYRFSSLGEVNISTEELAEGNGSLHFRWSIQ